MAGRSLKEVLLNLSHILVATDLSEASRISYGYACALARATGARVTVLHVDELAEIGFRSSQAMLQYMEHVATVREQRMVWAESEFDRLGHKATMIEIPGHAWTEIDRFALEHAVDMIVVTRHGDHATGALGSTSQRVVHHAAVPVMVVHEPANYQPGETEAPGLTRLLAATDFSRDSTMALTHTLSLAESLGGVAKVVHVWRNPGSAIPNDQGMLPVTPEVVLEELQRTHETRFMAWLAEAGVRELDHLVVPGHSPAVGLIAAAIEYQASAICVPTHGHSAIERMLVGSTVDRLVTLSPLPVLVYPRGWLVKNP